MHSRPRNASFGIKVTGTEKQDGGEKKEDKEAASQIFLKSNIKKQGRSRGTGRQMEKRKRREDNVMKQTKRKRQEEGRERVRQRNRWRQRGGR